MATKMNSMSKNRLNADGYVAEIVERYNPRSRRSNDLFGFADVIAFKSERCFLIQVTSASNRADRLKKVLENNTAAFLVATKSAEILMHIWAKKSGRWKLEQVNITTLVRDYTMSLKPIDAFTRYHELKDMQGMCDD